MAAINGDKYAEMLASRLNHLQMLQSTVSGLLVTFGLGAIIAAEKIAGVADPCTLLNVILVILVLGHFFSVYQSFAVIKCVIVLTNLEKDIQGYQGPRYYEANFERLSLYVLTHNIQFFVAMAFPFFLTRCGAFSTAQALVWIGVIAMTTAAICLVYARPFFPGLQFGSRWRILSAIWGWWAATRAGKAAVPIVSATLIVLPIIYSATTPGRLSRRTARLDLVRDSVSSSTLRLLCDQSERDSKESIVSTRTVFVLFVGADHIAVCPRDCDCSLGRIDISRNAIGAIQWCSTDESVEKDVTRKKQDDTAVNESASPDPNTERNRPTDQPQSPGKPLSGDQV